MTKLQIWKTRIKRGENEPDYLYSLRFEKDIPVVLTKRQFKTLFSDIDLSQIPMPEEGKAIIEIEGIIKKMV